MTTMKKPEPQFRHDCSACTYLGEFEGADLYHCPQHGMPTLVARRSADGPDYSATMSAWTVRPAGMLSRPMFLKSPRLRLKGRKLPTGVQSTSA